MKVTDISVNVDKFLKSKDIRSKLWEKVIPRMRFDISAEF